MVKDAVPLPGYPEPYGLLCAILQDATCNWRSEIPCHVGPEAYRGGQVLLLVDLWRSRPA